LFSSQQRYEEELRPKLKEELGLGNLMEVPRLVKINLNMGVSHIKSGGKPEKALEKAQEELALISAQKPVVTRARKSVAGFKLRKGMQIGCKVTLRRGRMYDFLDRLVHIAIPRIRDFRGLSAKAFDGQGNYSLGISEQIIFPEIDYDKIDGLRGLDVTIVTSAPNDEQGLALLRAFDFPLRT